MAGTLSVSDRQVDELEHFIQEVEAADEGVHTDIQIRGERAIKFCAGWGRLRIYVIRNRFAGVDLLDWDADILETGKTIIYHLQSQAAKKAFIKNVPATQFIS